MTDRVRSILCRDLPNWCLWAFTLIAPAVISVIAFSATAYSDQRNDQRYVQKSTYERDHIEYAKSIDKRDAEITRQFDELKAQMSYNNRMTERNNAILERLDKK